MTTTMTTPPAADPAETQTPAAVAVPQRRAAPRNYRTVMALGGISVIVAASWAVSASFNSSGDGNDDSLHTITRRSFSVTELTKGELKAAKTIDIKSKVEGRGTILWLIDEGTIVKEGDLLVRLASDKIEENIRQKESSEASAIAALEAADKEHEILVDQNKSDIRKAALKQKLAIIDLEKYIKGDAKKSFNDAKLEIERAKQKLEQAKLEHQAAVKLRAQEIITKRELLQDVLALHEAEWALEKADLNQEVLEKYSHPRELQQKESDVAETEKELERVKKGALARESKSRADVEAKRANLMHTQNELRKFREQKEFCEIKAPSPGLVVYFSGHRWNPSRIAEGAEVYQGQTIVSLPDPSVMIVLVRIHEAKTNRIKLEQETTVELDGLPGRVFTGRVTKIAPLADSRNQWLNPDLKQYETEITLDQAHEDLKPGMTARVEIMIDQVEDALAVPVQCVFAKSGRHFVFSKDKSSEPIEVTIGRSNSEYVEIEEGVEVGDQVMLAVSEELRRTLPEPDPDAEPAERLADFKAGSAKSASGTTGKKPPKGMRRGGGKGRRGGARRTSS